MRLDGNVAIMTGAAKGLRKSFSDLSADEGAKVGATDIGDSNGPRS